jgi:hypothetical protein
MNNEKTKLCDAQALAWLNFSDEFVSLKMPVAHYFD